jgi:hypothetical protein
MVAGEDLAGAVSAAAEGRLVCACFAFCCCCEAARPSCTCCWLGCNCLRSIVHPIRMRASTRLLSACSLLQGRHVTPHSLAVLFVLLASGHLTGAHGVMRCACNRYSCAVCGAGQVLLKLRCSLFLQCQANELRTGTLSSCCKAVHQQRMLEWPAYQTFLSERMHVCRQVDCSGWLADCMLRGWAFSTSCTTC